MAAGPETRFISKIHRKLHKDTWKIRLQMGMGSPRGIPDMLYLGDLGSLFIEYKYIANWDKKRTVPMDKLSDNQVVWIERALETKVPVAVIIGDENGKSLYLDTLRLKEGYAYKATDLITPAQVAAKIEDTICSQHSMEIFKTQKSKL